MTQAERDQKLMELFDRMRDIFKTKGADYASQKDTLSNFKDEARKLGITPYQVLMVYKNKHETAILKAVLTNPAVPRRSGETIEESLIDSIVYNFLFLCLLDEQETQCD